MRVSPIWMVAVVLIVWSLSPTAGADDPPKPPVTLTAQQDRQTMLDQLKIPAATMRRGPSGMNPKAPDYQNTDEAKANPWPNLPEMMVTKGRKPVDYAGTVVEGAPPRDRGVLRRRGLRPGAQGRAEGDLGDRPKDKPRAGRFGGGFGGRRPAPTVPSVTKRLVGQGGQLRVPGHHGQHPADADSAGQRHRAGAGHDGLRRRRRDAAVSGQGLGLRHRQPRQHPGGQRRRPDARASSASSTRASRASPRTGARCGPGPGARAGRSTTSKPTRPWTPSRSASLACRATARRRSWRWPTSRGSPSASSARPARAGPSCSAATSASRWRT